jgi:hypothetical protein
MKGVKITVVASILLAMAFIFSCSSDDNNGGGGNKLVNCEIVGVCVSDTYTSEQCTAGGGTVVTGKTCNSTVSCNIGGFCSQMPSAVLCTQSGGEVVESCEDSNSSGSGGASDGYLLNCYMTAESITLDSIIKPTPTVQCSSTGPISPSKITWENNPPKEVGNVVVKARVSEGCGTPKEANCGTILVKAYCDYGEPTTGSENGCKTVTEKDSKGSICDLEYGILVKSCNSLDRRKDLIYCDWGEYKGPNNGGCYRAPDNSADKCRAANGNAKTKCPEDSL